MLKANVTEEEAKARTADARRAHVMADSMSAAISALHDAKLVIIDVRECAELAEAREALGAAILLAELTRERVETLTAAMDASERTARAHDDPEDVGF
jgi:hypothetical protein